MKRFSALIAAALVLAGCGSSGGDASDSTVSTDAADATSAGPAGGTAASDVAIKGFAYSPDPVTVDAGTTVTFANEDSAPHTATADDASFDTGSLGEGDSKAVSFKSPGRFAYTCTIHPFMHGTVVVK